MLLARPRLVGAAVVGLLALQALPWLMPLQDITRYIVAWNVGVLLYLALVGWMMFSEGRQQIRHWAKLEDEGQALVMTLVILAALASLAAIVMELAVVKDLHGWRRAGHILLAILTIFSSWAFIHVMFALHYARSYYASHARGLPPGLEFPARKSRITAISSISPASSAPPARPPMSATPPARYARWARCIAYCPFLQCHGAGLDDQYRRRPDLKPARSETSC